MKCQCQRKQLPRADGGAGGGQWRTGRPHQVAGNFCANDPAPYGHRLMPGLGDDGAAVSDDHVFGVEGADGNWIGDGEFMKYVDELR